MPPRSRVPPQLRAFLFKKGHAPVRRRKRRKNPGLLEMFEHPWKKSFDEYDRQRGVVRNPSGNSAKEVARLRRALRAQRLAQFKRAPRRVYTIITATLPNKKRVPYDGKHFSTKHAPYKFVSASAAETKARALIRQFPVLQKYVIEIQRA